MTRRKYDLYYTLNSSGADRSFSDSEKELFWKTSRTLDLSQSKAVMLLIYEHHLVQSDALTIPDPIAIPYNGKQRKNVVSFRDDKLPQTLKWILFKFFEVISGSP